LVRSAPHHYHLTGKDARLRQRRGDPDELPIAVADAMTIAACYHSRWGIDKGFDTWKSDGPLCQHRSPLDFQQ
jgi:hypothetical protein